MCCVVMCVGGSPSPYVLVRCDAVRGAVCEKGSNQQYVLPELSVMAVLHSLYASHFLVVRPLLLVLVSHRMASQLLMTQLPRLHNSCNPWALTTREVG